MLLNLGGCHVEFKNSGKVRIHSRHLCLGPFVRRYPSLSQHGLDAALGVGGHRVCRTKGTTRFSLIKTAPTSRPFALRVPQRLP